MVPTSAEHVHYTRKPVQRVHVVASKSVLATPFLYCQGNSKMARANRVIEESVKNRSRSMTAYQTFTMFTQAGVTRERIAALHY